jgi:hypothetical protein
LKELLEEKLKGLIHLAVEIETGSLWIKFSIIYSVVTCKTPSKEIIRNYFCKAQEWIIVLLNYIGDKCVCYTKSKVNPIHACHALPCANISKHIQNCDSNNRETGDCYWWIMSYIVILMSFTAIFPSIGYD